MTTQRSEACEFPADKETTYEYRDVTPLGWGRRLHAKVFVSEAATRLIEEYGGRE